MASANDKALAARELALAEKEKKIEIAQIRHRSNLTVADVKEGAMKALAKAKSGATAAGEISAMLPIFDAVAEFGGIGVESLIKKKWSGVHDYVAVGAFAVETVLLYEIATGSHKPGMLEALRLGAAGARGARMRSTVAMADSLIDKVFG